MIEIPLQDEHPGIRLRTALSLSALSRDAFRFDLRPALGVSPLSGSTRTVVEAFAEVFDARLDHFGADSNSLVFAPSRDDTQARAFQFHLDPPESVVDLLVWMLPALLLRDRSTRLVLTGGTHVPGAFLPKQVSRTLVPLVEEVGGKLAIELEEYGFPPRGRGRLVAKVEPVRGRPETPDWRDRGELEEVEVEIVLVHLQTHVGRREIDGLVDAKPDDVPMGARILEVHDAPSQGNVMIIEVRSSRIVETLALLGERGVRAEKIAERGADELLPYLSSRAAFRATTPAAALLMTPAGEGRLSTTHLDETTSTFAELVPEFLRADLHINEIRDGHVDLHLESRTL